MGATCHDLDKVEIEKVYEEKEKPLVCMTISNNGFHPNVRFFFKSVYELHKLLNSATDQLIHL